MKHVKNIKDMLNISTGSRNVATSGFSSFTDSQFFVGSQFWPENSQGTSQDVSLSSKTSQQSSEGSDPKLANSYHTKPLLFGELKDKNNFGILDRFEEDKKRAKEKVESDFLAKECHGIRETLNRIQQLVTGTERGTAVCQTVLEKFDSVVTTLQNNLNSLQSDISQQSETLLSKMSSQTDMMTELEEKVKKSGEAIAEFDLNLESIKKNLECLTEDQERERNMISEALKLLNTLVNERSAKATSERVLDNAVQTSPVLDEPFCNILLNNKFQNTHLTSLSYNLENHQGEVPPHYPTRVTGRKKFSRRERAHKKRPLVLSKRRKHIVTDENHQPLMNIHKQDNEGKTITTQDSLSSDSLKHLNGEKTSPAAGCFITPLSCWSQDSNSSVCLQEIDPILEKLSAEYKKVTPAKSEGLWQLFDMDSDSVLGF